MQWCRLSSIHRPCCYEVLKLKAEFYLRRPQTFENNPDGMRIGLRWRAFLNSAASHYRAAKLRSYKMPGRRYESAAERIDNASGFHAIARVSF